jgi:putative phosphoribosyl transferase
MNGRALFHDREDAGHRLAAELAGYAGRRDLLVLALPRGGVPVAFPVAQALGAPLDVLVVRKLGVPGHPRLAMGAIAAGTTVVDPGVTASLQIPDWVLEREADRERAELERREGAYREGRPPHEVAGKTVIVVDDGIATGATVRAAVTALRARGPARIVVAAPVASPRAVEALERVADRVVCVEVPARFRAVGELYGDFPQTSDAEVKALLRAAGDSAGAAAVHAGRAGAAGREW